MAVPKPDYLSRDYVGLRQSLLDYGVQSARDNQIQWNPGSEGDFGMLMVELFSYVGDILSYYTDRAQMENYLSTATQRESVLGLAYLLGYVPTSGAPATGTVTLVTDENSDRDIAVPMGTQVSTGLVSAVDGPVTFEVQAHPTRSDGSWLIPKAAETQVEVPVVEGVTESDVLIGESTGQPTQSFILPHPGVYAESVSVTIEGQRWTRQEHLLDADPFDRVFEISATDTTTVVTFGDDINGAIPATGLAIYATYRHGVGAFGNVSAGQVHMIDGVDLGTVHVAKNEAGAYMSSPMTGGSDPEDTERIRYNAPRAYRTQNRAVSKDDFRDLALGVPGVTKANVVTGTFTSVTIYITGPDGGDPSESLKQMVKDRVTDKTLAGVHVTVATPSQVPIRVGTVAQPVRIEIKDQYSKATVDTEVRKNIKNMISRMPFGQKLTVGRLYDVISDVDGVRYIDIDAMVRQDASSQTGTVTLNPRSWEIFTTNDDLITLSITGGTT